MLIQTGARFAAETLVANKTFYVRTDGSDSNSGLANTSGSAFLTVQRGVDEAYRMDLRQYNVTIQIADGTYNGAIALKGKSAGGGTITINGNSGTPANVILTNTGSNILTVSRGASVIISNFRFSTSSIAIHAIHHGEVIFGAGIQFAANTNYHMLTEAKGSIYSRNSYSIVGGSTYHMLAHESGSINLAGITVTLTGTPAFSVVAYAAGGFIQYWANTFSGSATGQRYNVARGGICFVNGGGASYIPGSVAGAGGTTTGGGFYG